LKQLQLIQILCIKTRLRTNAAFAAANACRVNCVGAHANGARAASGNADTPSGLGKSGSRGALRFTAR